MIGIIGGSGLYNLQGAQVIREHELTTPFGNPSSPIVEMEVHGSRFFFLPRHGVGHIYSPSEINYRANIYAMKKVGVTYLVSASAVGSLKEEIHPGMFVLVDQFIDWTKGLRERTFFGNGMVGHVSAAHPVEKRLAAILEHSCKAVGANYATGGSYLCIEGPQFSTKAESMIYRSFGASVIGMTNVPEAFLAKEAGLAYATIAMVTDYDCWKDEHCTVSEIVKVMKENTRMAQKLIIDFIPRIYKERFHFEKENQYAVMTADNHVSSSQREILEVLLK